MNTSKDISKIKVQEHIKQRINHLNKNNTKKGVSIVSYNQQDKQFIDRDFAVIGSKIGIRY